MSSLDHWLRESGWRYGVAPYAGLVVAICIIGVVVGFTVVSALT